MQKLKSYISALIEAAFGKKKAFISSQAMVNNSWTDINDGDSTYVAAHDGYLKIGFATTDTNMPWVRADITNNLSINVPAVGSVGSQTCVYIPVKKGITFNSAAIIAT